MDLTSPSEATMIGLSRALARKAVQVGLECPAKAIDEASARLRPTPVGRGLQARLTGVVGSSVAMDHHRFIPLSSSDEPAVHVTAASEGEVRS